MASSRRRPPVEAPLAALRDALARIGTDRAGHASGPGRISDPNDSGGPYDPILVAFSGGLDSTVLLRAAVELLGPARDGSVSEAAGQAASAAPALAAIVPPPSSRLLAIHVDHGLQAPSTDWARHCVDTAAALGIDCRVVRLAGTPRRGESIEAWARERRYAAFDRIAEEVGAQVLLTAHHADDQLETFLLRLARGSGLDGLVSIEPDTMRAGLRVLRPFLGLPRSVLERWARSRGLAWIEDPSNHDETLLRNAVRRQLVPTIDRVLPALRQRLPATLAALREDRDRLREIDRGYLQGVIEPPRVAIEGSSVTIEPSSRAFEPSPIGAERPDAKPGLLPGQAVALSLPAWRELPASSRAGVLRQWLALHGARMPTRARLAEMRRQLDAPAADGLELRHDGFVLRRYRGQAMLVPEKRPPGNRDPVPTKSPRAASTDAASTDAASIHPASTDLASVCEGGLRLHWRGERRIEIPRHAAVLSIERVEQPGRPGLDERWLQAPDLELCQRTGGERLRMRPGGPHRSLKNLYQERGVPAWARRALPLLWACGRPIWAAGIGCDADCLVTEGVRYALGWQPLRLSAPASTPGGSRD